MTTRLTPQQLTVSKQGHHGSCCTIGVGKSTLMQQLVAATLDRKGNKLRKNAMNTPWLTTPSGTGMSIASPYHLDVIKVAGECNPSKEINA